jgi:hypothetical protein
MAVRVARGSQWGWKHDSAAPRFLWWGALTSLGVKGLITLVAGSIPGILLCVICWFSLGADFSTLFAVGFCVSIMGGHR